MEKKEKNSVDKSKSSNYSQFGENREFHNVYVVDPMPSTSSASVSDYTNKSEEIKVQDTIIRRKRKREISDASSIAVTAMKRRKSSCTLDAIGEVEKNRLLEDNNKEVHILTEDDNIESKRIHTQNLNRERVKRFRLRKKEKILETECRTCTYSRDIISHDKCLKQGQSVGTSIDSPVNKLTEDDKRKLKRIHTKHLTKDRVKRYRVRSKEQNVEKESVSTSIDYPEEHQLLFNPIHSPTYEEDYLGEMSFACKHCEAKHFRDEQVAKKSELNEKERDNKELNKSNEKGKGKEELKSYNDCCGHGGVKLQLLDYPLELKGLLDGSNKKSNHFKKNIRCYNNSFAFASFNAKVINFNEKRRGPFCFKIQGQIYYQMNNALYPDIGDDPSYGQLFIYDPDDAIDYRINKNGRLDRDVLREIEDVMRKHNVFTKSFNMMKDVLEIETALANERNEEIPELKLLFTLKKGMDPRRFNFQRVNEVAAIFNTNCEGEIPESYVTVYNKASKELQLISSLDPCVEPFIYPIFYPFGDKGYCINMIRGDKEKRSKKHRISRADYVKYKIGIRENVFNQFLYGGRLFQQWLVDSYVKVEKDRLQYCANHQTQLRSETYKGLIDHITNTAEENDTPIGKMVVLPSTFINSPRHMMEQYQDSMAIVCKHGKPDLFITMTCNPQWKEIVENLLPTQTAADRPDIVARVFFLKVRRLIDCIVKKKCFGEVKSYVYVIEFQKRGLPHIHLLVILKSNSKILTTETVDRYISAEIPDKNVNSTLHEIIMSNNIHGPCGDWCFVDGKCSKKFPKILQEETTLEDNCYVLYRRKDTGQEYEKSNGYIVDNRFVVPYCPKLSQQFNSHINVEVVSSIKSVKYIYKYIYKGHDAASIIITNSNGEATINHNEINHYEENRYVGPVEAAWRILGKHLSKKSHSVCRLPIHLPNEQNVLIRQGQADKKLSFDLNKTTKLLDYFNLNERDVDARNYFYSQIPEYYSWNKETCRWNKRSLKENVVGRMYSVSPCEIDLFHLRLLLLTIKGAISFESLRTVNGVTHDTFTTTCLTLGLIENDHEWKETLQEATVWMMPQSLRRLFVRILIHCRPLNAGELWEQFKVNMSEDYLRNFDNIIAENKAYTELKNLLSEEGYNLHDFLGLPPIEDICNNVYVPHPVNVEEEKRLGTERYDKLNVKQKEIVDFVLSAAHDSSEKVCHCVYVDGPGGSGKTFMYITLWHLLRTAGKQVCNMAFTGIAATLLPMGKTVHKVLGLPVPLYNDSSSSIKIQSKEGLFLKDVDVFIWDEAPMSPRYALEIMDRTLRDMMQVDVPFGGKIIILGGDFRQVLPIKEKGTRSEIINLSIKNSKLWKHFSKFTLSENMRVLPEETEFTEFLLKIGNGTLNDEKDCVQLPRKIIEKKNKDICQDMYEDLIKQKRFEELALCAILAPRNIDVDDINNQVVQLLDNDKEKVYKSIDCIDNRENINDHEVILAEYLNTLLPSGLPPHLLHLRINSVVMLIRNLSINEGLCNGTRLLVLDLSNHVIKCQILTGDKCGNVVFIHRVLLYCENVYPFTFKRRQFPIKLAFAMTINKSQGQTFNKIAIDLRKDVFNHGQLYVALSRVRSFDSVKVYLGNQRSEKYIKNYVYKEIFE